MPSTMPDCCSDRSAPFTARNVPMAVNADCQSLSCAAVVDTVCGGSASAAMACLIMPARKLTNQARAANTAPTTHNMIIMRFNMASGFRISWRAGSAEPAGPPRG
ncbi:hypothetical protein ACVI1J_009390 [Bradyrhizobium diazoefficiens]